MKTKQSTLKLASTESKFYLFPSSPNYREHETILHEKKVRHYKRGEEPPSFPEDSSYISISNPSLRDVVVEEDVEDERSLRAMFNYDQMKNMFDQYEKIAHTEGVDVLPDTLDFCKEIFTTLTQNDNEIAEKLYDSIVLVDNTYPRRFVEFAHVNNPNSGFLTNVKSKARDHLVRQFKKILEFHRILVNAFINDKVEANRLMNLLGLSHYLMRVSVDDFDLLALASIKLLLHLNICNEENVIHAVGYFCIVTKRVRSTINDYYKGREKMVFENELRKQMEEMRSISFDKSDVDSLDDTLVQSIMSKGGTMNLWARQNYRAMKDWLLVQEEVRRNVLSRNPLATETNLYVERVHLEMSTIDKSSSAYQASLNDPNSDKSGLNEKCFLTWLKKGYKFKTTENNISHRRY